MQYSIVPYAEIDLGNRIDAEYFQPTYLELEKRLESLNGIPLRNFCSITGSAFYPAATHLYESGDLPFIRYVDCISYPIVTTRQNNSFEKIPTYFANEQKNIKTLSRGEIVITKVGSPCYASIIHDLDVVALSRTVLGLKSIHGINPYYLVVYLRSKYGFSQLVRERELTIQYQLTLDRVGSVLIFKPKNEILEEKIAQSFLLYEEAIKNSELLFKEAQNLLLSELGLANWQPKHRLSFVRNFSEVEKSARIDAEYFQPKYDEIVNAIKSYAGGWDSLGNLVRHKKQNFTPKDKEIYKYIELSNIAGNGEITDCTLAEGQDLPSRARRKVAKGDVIVSSIEGSLSSIALVGKEYHQALCSTGFHVINAQKINSETLLVLLKSTVGQLQLKKGCSGTILTAINNDEFSRIILPIISQEKQLEIQTKVSESFALRAKSKSLLEAAKRAVEMAIEEGEEKALAWLKEQTL